MLFPSENGIYRENSRAHCGWCHFYLFFLWSPGSDDVLGPLDVALPSFLLKEAFLYLAMKNIFLKQKYWFLNKMTQTADVLML